MLYEDFTEKLLGLQDINIEEIGKIDNCIHLYCHLKRKTHKCPYCGKCTDKIHDYREQIIKDISGFEKIFYIHLKKRRYRCPCGKRFAEKNSFLPRCHRITNRLSLCIIEKLRSELSFSSVAREVRFSGSTVIRVLTWFPIPIKNSLMLFQLMGLKAIQAVKNISVF